MDRRGAPEFILEAFADPNSVRDVVKGEFYSS
jgi:autophagy-related protein 101